MLDRCWRGVPSPEKTRKRARLIGLVMALSALSTLAYVRSLWLPLISDDYLQVQLGRQYGPVSSWPALAADPLYRSRSTSILLTHWTEQLFGISVMAFNLTSLVLHILNTLLVFALGKWKPIGWRAAFVAAAFFAVYEGHQEAVIWYSALPELLLFFFGLGTLLLWILWLERRAGQRSGVLYGAALASFVLALLSKEPAVVLVPLLAMLAWMHTRNWRCLTWVLPFAVLAALNIAGIFLGRNGNQHFQDGTFSLDAPFWLVWRNSIGRLFWVAGLASMLFLVASRQFRKHWPMLGPAFIWIGITLLPFCFLTYMPRIPSRHTYLASAGLSLVVAAGFLALEERTWIRRRWLPGAVAALLIAGNCGYLWTRKHAQYLERAEPTESLIRFVKNAQGPVHIHCFPYYIQNAELAIEIGAGKPSSTLVVDPSPGPGVTNLFCLGGRDHQPISRAALLANAPDEPLVPPASR